MGGHVQEKWCSLISRKEANEFIQWSLAQAYPPFAESVLPSGKSEVQGCTRNLLWPHPQLHQKELFHYIVQAIKNFYNYPPFEGYCFDLYTVQSLLNLFSHYAQARLSLLAYLLIPSGWVACFNTSRILYNQWQCMLKNTE